MVRHLISHRNLAVLFYFTFLIILCGSSILHSRDSFDTIGYVGAAKLFETNDNKILHAFIYKNLKNNIANKDDYESLFNTPYRRAVSESPDLFRQQMPFYQIRIVYTSLIFAAHKLGLNYFTAAHLITALAILTGFIFFYFTFRNHIDVRLWYTLPFFILLMGFVRYTKLANTDAIAFMGVAITCYLLFKNIRFVFLFLPLLVLMRTDLILFNILVTGYIYYYYKEWRVQSIASLIAAFILFFLVNSLFSNYNWSTLFYFSFIDRVPNPADIHPTITLSMYLDVLLAQLKTQLTGERLMVFSIITILIWINSAPARLSDYLLKNPQNRLLCLSAICVLYVVVHFLLFPASWYRFFLGQYTLAFFILLIQLTQSLPSLKSREIWQ